MPTGHSKEDNFSVKCHTPRQVCQVANQDESSHQLTELVFEHQELFSVRTDTDPLMTEGDLPVGSLYTQMIQSHG